MKNYNDILKIKENTSFKPITIQNIVETPSFKNLWNKVKENDTDNHITKGCMISEMMPKDPTLLQFSAHLLDLIYSAIKEVTSENDLSTIKRMQDALTDLKEETTVLLTGKNTKTQNIEIQLFAFLLDFISKKHEK